MSNVVLWKMYNRCRVLINNDLRAESQYSIINQSYSKLKQHMNTFLSTVCLGEALLEKACFITHWKLRRADYCLATKEENGYVADRVRKQFIATGNQYFKFKNYLFYKFLLFMLRRKQRETHLHVFTLRKVSWLEFIWLKKDHQYRKAVWVKKDRAYQSRPCCLSL